jgi:hypothetical protein
LQARNDLLLEAIHNIFDLPESPSREDLKGKFSNERIAALYEFIDQLWPKQTDVYTLLPDVADATTAYFVGEARPEELLQNVLRLSLYVDRLFALDPFTKSWRTRPEYRPTLHPDHYQWLTLRLVLWALELEPWIRSGIVTVIPDPFDFDDDFIRFALDEAQARPMPELDPRDEERLTRHTRDEMFGFWLSLPEEYLAKKARELGATDTEITGLSKYLAEIRRLSPFPDLTESDKRREQMYQMDIGGPIEDALLICQLTGAFPYTDLYNRREELARFARALPGEANVWSPLSFAFTTLNFQFLNNVNINYIEDLRHQDRPSMMRAYLRKIWRTVSSDLNVTDSTVKDFTDELKDQYRIAQEQWKAIDVAASASVANTALGSLASLFLLGSPLAMLAGQFAPFIPAAGFAAGSLVALWEAREKRRALRRSVPLSIFVELGH